MDYVFLVYEIVVNPFNGECGNVVMLCHVGKQSTHFNTDFKAMYVMLESCVVLLQQGVNVFNSDQIGGFICIL